VKCKRINKNEWRSEVQQAKKSHYISIKEVVKKGKAISETGRKVHRDVRC
jgi:hypothetical protein